MNKPLNLENTDSIQWDETADVIITGFGGAGACAAIEAFDNGARVFIIERFSGGGATTRSGGVYYAGGGTDQQEYAGYNDTAKDMFNYLKMETRGAVSDETLKDFCSRSKENLQWLKSLGMKFSLKFFEQKTTQPPGGYGLYFSGNERQYHEKANVAPRGHVPLGSGMNGSVFFGALKKAVFKRKIDVRYHCRSERLILDKKGRVVGLQVYDVGRNLLLRAMHMLLFYGGFLAVSFRKMNDLFERSLGKKRYYQARKGIIISSGGFVFNKGMMEEFAPVYARTMCLGTPGDDGRGIMLGHSAGADIIDMASCAASRFYAPPEPFVFGVLVDDNGNRICDESLYGATLSSHIAENGGRAFLVVDESIMTRAIRELKKGERIRDYSIAEILTGKSNALVFRKMTTYINKNINRKKAKTLKDLERKCHIPAGKLTETIEIYNRNCMQKKADEYGKLSDLCYPIATPPYYAIYCGLDSRLFLSPCITLGGLRVDEKTGQVLNIKSKPISGLYAAGRSAAGICSRSYVSGLSLADCVYTGRRAGKNAAVKA